MPEKGDTVRLYFPTEKEKHAYVISSVHLEVSDSDGSGSSGETGSNPAPRTDPDYKSIKNSAGKEILFAPNSISIINPEVGSIVLEDSSGITITSNQDVKIQATEKIFMRSDASDLSMEAEEELKLTQGDTATLVLNNTVSMNGAKVKIQEE